MRKPYFEVMADCPLHGIFTVQCKRDKYLGTDGKLHFIEKVVCPRCGMHAGITRIESAA